MPRKLKPYKVDEVRSPNGYTLLSQGDGLVEDEPPRRTRKEAKASRGG